MSMRSRIVEIKPKVLVSEYVAVEINLKMLCGYFYIFLNLSFI